MTLKGDSETENGERKLTGSNDGDSESSGVDISSGAHIRASAAYTQYCAGLKRLRRKPYIYTGEFCILLCKLHFPRHTDDGLSARELFRYVRQGASA